MVLCMPAHACSFERVRVSCGTARCTPCTLCVARHGVDGSSPPRHAMQSRAMEAHLQRFWFGRGCRENEAAAALNKALYTDSRNRLVESKAAAFSAALATAVAGSAATSAVETACRSTRAVGHWLSPWGQPQWPWQPVRTAVHFSCLPHHCRCSTLRCGSASVFPCALVARWLQAAQVARVAKLAQVSPRPLDVDLCVATAAGAATALTPAIACPWLRCKAGRCRAGGCQAGALEEAESKQARPLQLQTR